jgi:hypothetical protein
MYDSVSVDQIPTDAEAAAGYVNGAFANYPQIVARTPHAHHLSISVRASGDAECLDVETGDATPSEAPAWVRRQLARGVHTPVLYANASTMPAVRAALDAAGLHRSDYSLWVAHFDGIAQVPAGYDAKQYEEHKSSPHADLSICLEEFFGAVHPPYAPEDEKRWEREWGELRGRNGPWAKLRRRVLKRTMLHRERLIVTLAESTGWGIRNRRGRYRALFALTQSR